MCGALGDVRFVPIADIRDRLWQKEICQMLDPVQLQTCTFLNTRRP